MKVSVAEARNRLTQLIQDVEKGERVTICRHGKPIVDLVPTQDELRQAPQFGMMKGKFKILDPHCFDPMSDEEFDAFLEGRY